MFRKLATNLFGVKVHRRTNNWASAQAQMEMLESRIVPTALLGLTTNNRLIQFDSSAPTAITSSVAVTGLAAGEDLVSIDTRPSNGLVYGLTDKNTLYTLNPNSGVATPVGAAALPLTGSRTEIDFNPTVDRLRVVSNSDQNFRINPINGALATNDTALAFADGADFGRDPNVIGAAYDRNFQGSTLTTLFGIDHVRNTLVRSGGVDGTPSPNGGQLTTVGSLGFNTDNRLGFDIDDDGTAFGAMNRRLYTIDLTTGQATLVGLIGRGTTLDSLTALPREEVIYGVSASNRLVSFRANDPGRLLSSVPISNLLTTPSQETISAIDFRPATGELFALTSTNRTLRINPANGQGTVVGAAANITPTFAAGAQAGLDFNPTVDRLRIVNASDDNIRFNPVTSTLAGTDTDLTFMAGDPNVAANPNIVGSAYDRNDNDDIDGSDGNSGTATTLFGIDSTLNILVRQGNVNGGGVGTGSPNDGLLTTLGSLGVDPTDMVGFDISGAGSGGNGAALAVMQIGTETVSKLFQINTTGGTNQLLGTASLVGTVGGGELIVAMAIAPPTIQFSQATFKATEKGGTASIVITRTGGSANVVTVAFSALAGTAQVGDFTSPNATVTFAAGETTKTITFAITRDAVSESAEDVLLTLSGITGGNTQLGLLSSALLIITDK